MTVTVCLFSGVIKCQRKENHTRKCSSTHSPGGPSDEDDGKDEPEHVAEDENLNHVQVRPKNI